MKTERLIIDQIKETDEANGTTHVSVIPKEDWLSEIGAEVINQQKEGLKDGI